MTDNPREQDTPSAPAASVDEVLRTEANLRRIARMFEPHRADPLMRELCLLAIKCAQERLI